MPIAVVLQVYPQGAPDELRMPLHLKREQILLHTELGSGHFGTVYKVCVECR